MIVVFYWVVGGSVAVVLDAAAVIGVLIGSQVALTSCVEICDIS